MPRPVPTSSARRPIVAAAKLAFDRAKRMQQDKLIADSAYDQAEAEWKMKTAAVESARRRVAQLQAQTDSTRDDLIKTTVISPMDGVVTNLPKEAGEMVIGAMSFSPTVIMTVADLSIMECEVMVDETDFRNLKLGQEAKIKVDALEGLEMKGEVTEIGASALVRGSGSQAAAQTTLGANTGNQPKDFKVTITIKDPPANLRPGLNATADITTAKREKVLAVPVQAVVVREVEQGRQGRGPRRHGRAAGSEREGNTVAQVSAREGRGEGRRLRRPGREGRLQAGEDGHHGRDRHRDHRGRHRGAGDRDRLLPDAPQPQGPGPPQDRAKGKKS